MMRRLIVFGVSCIVGITLCIAGCRDQQTTALSHKQGQPLAAPTWTANADESMAKALPVPVVGRATPRVTAKYGNTLPACLRIEKTYRMAEIAYHDAARPAAILASVVPQPTAEPAEVLLAARTPEPAPMAEIIQPLPAPDLSNDGPELEPILDSMTDSKETSQRPIAEVLISFSGDSAPEMPMPTPEMGLADPDLTAEPEMATLN